MSPSYSENEDSKLLDMLYDHHGQVLRQYDAVAVKIESQSYMYGTVQWLKSCISHTWTYLLVS